MSLSLAKTASACLNEKVLCLSTTSTGAMTVNDPDGLELFLSPCTGDVELGEAVRACLELSRLIPNEERKTKFHQTEVVKRYELWKEKMMTLSGVSSKRTLFKRLKLCSISSKDGLIKFCPLSMIKMETWQSIKGAEVEVPETCSNEELGAALRLAFERCE
jgi:hypothetical protein